MKPSSLQPRGHVRFQEQTFSFHLTPTQASAIAQSGCRDPYGRQEYKKQIQLRFSLLGKTIGIRHKSTFLSNAKKGIFCYYLFTFYMITLFGSEIRGKTVHVKIKG